MVSYFFQLQSGTLHHTSHYGVLHFYFLALHWLFYLFLRTSYPMAGRSILLDSPPLYFYTPLMCLLYLIFHSHTWPLLPLSSFNVRYSTSYSWNNQEVIRVDITTPRSLTSIKFNICLESIKVWSVWLKYCSSGDLHVILWIFFSSFYCQ
jgi:hypothetical protein